ncbi:hypothetical protein B0A49_13323 [Cryomyces minteri]|uniref:Uncharacterized protein n=1 Tax=Cryomyces minteri TaxID=331657 RepID=A0A4U0X146_9PEZI|nr:hypothetical protein B0A49_13323 [Cryomyces minteri]
MEDDGLIVEDPVITEAMPNGSTSNGEDIKVPTTLIFGTVESPDEYSIPHRHLERIPKHVLVKLLTGQTFSHDGISIHRLGSTIWHESLLRLKQYLYHNDYYPFNPNAELQVVDCSGNITAWPGPSHTSDKSRHQGGLQTTDATHELFRKEVELYGFAALVDYTEFRNFSSNKLCTAYPAFARETLHLLECLYRIALKLDDKPLVDFIETSTKRNRESLIKQPQFLPLLRQSVQQDPLSKVLLESHIAASQAAQADLLLATIPVKTAPADGYGTLVKEGTTLRNRDFTFIEDELLLADYSNKPVIGRHNITVENARGMRGDVLASLFMVVPPGLGTVMGSVNCGIKPKIDRDREMRTDPYANHTSRKRKSYESVGTDIAAESAMSARRKKLATRATQSSQEDVGTDVDMQDEIEVAGSTRASARARKPSQKARESEAVDLVGIAEVLGSQRCR